ncbi:MAG: hypothetical protein PVG41_02830 [Desulfobacteraceae bacterium]
MSNHTRREILVAAVAGTIYTAFSPIRALAADPCMVDHPLMPPRKDFSGQCPNCGMVRPMWARTWITFENSDDVMNGANGQSNRNRFNKLGLSQRRSYLVAFEKATAAPAAAPGA